MEQYYRGRYPDGCLLLLFVAARELQETDSKFRALYRMTKEAYLELSRVIAPFINYTDTNMRECVSTEERLLITLRYLATGCTFVSLSLYFARGESSVMYIIHETTKVIWEALKHEHLPVPTEDKWKTIAQRSYSLWNLPNCLGALDGKHIRIEKLPGTGSSNFNYKGYHSVVLLACSDADGLFTAIETGYAGRNSDGGIFRASAIRHWITHEGLNIPRPSTLPHDEYEFPYYFVGDEAFPLTPYLLRPYPQKTLDNVKRIFNYRLSRGRKTVECAFGMMTKKVQVLSNPIRCRTTETVIDIVKAVCVLHNFVRVQDGVPYTQPSYDNTKLADDAITIPPQNLVLQARPTANEIRNYLANYFLTPYASLPYWQWKYFTY